MNTATKRRRTRAVGIASMLAGAGAAAVVMAAPASAAVGSVTATPGPTGQFGTSCSYDLVATAPTGKEVVFGDNGVIIGTSVADNGTATLKWTPTTPGFHKIQARQINPVVGGAKEFQTTVRPGVNLGSLCLAF